jgi:hypothetical protein
MQLVAAIITAAGYGMLALGPLFLAVAGFHAWRGR